MRVTDNMRVGSALTNLSSLRSQHLRATREASTGLRVLAPSDDPAAAARLTRIQRMQSDGEAISRSLAMGRIDLELAEGTLASSAELMKRAKELAMTASNDALPADARASIADEVASLREALRALANTKGSRGSLFAGSKTDAEAFDASFTFQGDDYEHSIRSGGNSQVTINASGARAFTAAGGRDIFADLEALETALRNNDGASVRASLDLLDQGHEQVTRERARTGVQLNRLAQGEEILSELNYLYESQKSEVAGVDPAESYSKLITLEQAVQRSISVTERLLSLSGQYLFSGQ